MSLQRRLPIHEREYAILVFPALAIFAFGMILPIFVGFYYSLTDWNGMARDFNLIGLKNYLRIFTDDKFIDSIGFTVKFAILNTLVQNLFALLFAMMLDAKLKGRTIYRAIIFAPVLLSPILCGYLWKVVFAKLMPAITAVLHLNMNLRLLENPKTVLFGVVLINNWQWIGYWMMVYLAALQSVPKELYEAIDIDGGTPWRKFAHITLPMIAPAITVCVLAITLGSFRVYELLVTATQGGPGPASESII